MEINVTSENSSAILDLFSGLSASEQLQILYEIANQHSHVMDMYLKWRNVFHFQYLPVDALTRIFFYLANSDFSTLVRFLWVSKKCRSMLLEVLPQLLCQKYGFSALSTPPVDIILTSYRMHKIFQNGQLLMTSFNSCTCIKPFSLQPASFSQLDDLMRCMSLNTECIRSIERRYFQRVLAHYKFPLAAPLNGVLVVLTPFFLLFWRVENVNVCNVKDQVEWYSHFFEQSMEFSHCIDFYQCNNTAGFHVVVYANFHIYIFHNLSDPEKISTYALTTKRDHLDPNLEISPCTKICAIENGFLMGQFNSHPAHVYVYKFQNNVVENIQCLYDYAFPMSMFTTFLSLPWSGAFVSATLSANPSSQFSRLRLTFHVLRNGDLCRSMDNGFGYEIERLLSFPFTSTLKIRSNSFYKYDTDMPSFIDSVTNYFIAVFISP